MIFEQPRNEDQTSSAERELQERKFRDITSYLVSAGYFRARAPSLSPFDKVVGGMCYCITHSHTHLDVDVLFRGDKSTTGQNIKLAEEIVHCMRAMGCPVALQAHQIRGRDWAQVQPAIAWLIKRMFEAKETLGSRLRQFSSQQFEKSYDAAQLGATRPERRPRRAPERKFRYAGSPLDSEESAVFACLLEYGDSLVAAASPKTPSKQGLERGVTDSLSRDLEKALERAEKDEEVHRGREEAAAKALQSEMMAAQQQQIAGAQVGQMVRLGAGEIAEAAKRYEVAKATGALSGGGDAFLEREAAVLEQRAAKARQTVEAARRKVAGLEAERDAAVAKVADVRAKIGESESVVERARREIAKLVQVEQRCDAAKKQDLEELKRLVILNETTKREEADFKADCKKKLAALEADLEAATAAVDDPDRLAEIEAMHAKVVAKDARLRRQVAASSRRIATTARLIDDVPTRTELVQYERRFHELYAQVATKLDETRKYYELYNSLDEILKIHQKEVTILNSIIDTYAQAMKTKHGKHAFLSQLEEMNAGLRKNLLAKKEALKKATDRASQEQAKFQHLVDEHRKYHTAVKDFHDECQKNEVLLARLQELKR
ncbi:hypothetical protein CTAYLR_005004 [Chrysophaeum taylorii]|uniref:CCDC93 coiled-coil domain-containing protein n=1 Tax=Chrysophaeum taylorii TaxID=2483200 RepID=A0AAD7UBG9_9STRA|nr:hypothetical protein CTAYLR_005004 [Chrysophaeum taylorii]